MCRIPIVVCLLLLILAGIPHVVEAQPVIPSTVAHAFVTRYPSARLKKWKEEKGSFIASFRQDGKVYEAFFSAAGEWDSTESKIKLTHDLPSAVKKGWDTCRFNDWEIFAIKQVTKPDGVVYRIDVYQLQNLGPDDADIADEYTLFFSTTGALIAADRTFTVSPPDTGAAKRGN